MKVEGSMKKSGAVQRALENVRKAFLSLVVILVGFAASGAYAANEDSRMAEVLKRDKLIVATFSSAPPFCYADEKGQLIGFDIDLARLIAKVTLGDEKKVEFITVTSEGRWPAVLSGRADIGIATTTVYAKRALKVAFTRPYIDSGISVLVREDANVDSVNDLNNEKFTLANLSNPQMAARAKRFMPNAKIKTFNKVSAMFLAVKTGQAHAMQMDTPVVSWYSTQSDGLKVLPENLGNIQGNAIFMRPGDFTWWRYVDTLVQEMQGGSLYSEYSDIYKKWFGRTPPPARWYAGKQ